jgi:phenylalanyl-tRNA synthetase beta chain
MKFSEKWLREWVDPPLDTEQLAHQLTMAGLEVDAIEPVAGAFSMVVVGEVLKVEPHPDADKLRVTEVDVGQTGPLSIVCGAPNVAVGMKVPVALVGAKLPGDFKIRKSKLRGVPSHGMLCSARELGLAEQAEGLMALPADAPVGEDLRVYLALDDVSIELGLTPNRGDCLSIAGIAREIGVLNRLDVQAPEIKPQPAKSKARLAVHLDAPEDCPHYAGRVIEGIDPTAETPLWLQEKLRRSGLRSLGPVVDVTNFVMLELGQPMHAFDLARIQGDLHVRQAMKGESLTLLDEQTLELSPGSLLIADEAGPLALAGIMGGLESAVQADTADIFLESAWFAPLAIAGRARSYGLHTDSSHRFERGVDPELQVRALERATGLLLDIVGGQAGPVIEVTEADYLPVRAPVTLREARIGRVLGATVEAKTVADILSRLGMQVKKLKTGWSVVPPGFRFDISIEEDLIEEVARIYGYDNLPSSTPSVRLEMPSEPEAEVPVDRIRERLVDLGYAEAITYSFVDPELEAALDPEHEPIALANPISSDMAVMRTSLWPGLVQALHYNLNRQQNRLFLFECGMRFIRQDTEILQENMLAGILSGPVAPVQWNQPARKVDFYDAKGHVEALLALTGHMERFSFRPEPNPVLHPGQSAAIYYDGDRRVGWVGALHPATEQALDLSQNAYVFEIRMDVLQAGEVPQFRPLSRYPSIRRDIALVVDEALPAAAVLECIRNAGAEHLTNIELFDVYMGEGIDSGRKSLALGLTLQDLSRTLKDTEVEQELNRILNALQNQLGATLRE